MPEHKAQLNYSKQLSSQGDSISFVVKCLGKLCEGHNATISIELFENCEDTMILCSFLNGYAKNEVNKSKKRACSNLPGDKHGLLSNY